MISVKRTTCSLRECTVEADDLPVRSIPSLPWHWPYPPIHLTLSFDRFTGYHELFLVLSTLQDCRNDSSGAISTSFISLLSLHNLGHAVVDIHSFPLMRIYLVLIAFSLIPT